MSDSIDEIEIRKAVKDRYSKLANTKSCCGGGEYASRIGYTKEEVSVLPGEVLEVSAGCGNPTAIAGLKAGETVLDLGSGGGIDVFLSARMVGPEGKAIGIDATPEMVWKARKAAKEMGMANVEFRLGEIECMPVESNTIDVVISNCVINLSPDKGKVFREAFRVLKPGGRIAVSDMVLAEEPSADEREKLRLWTSCIGGAIPLQEYIEKMTEAGFTDINIESKHVYTIEELAYMLSEPSGCGCGAPMPVVPVSDGGLSKVASVRITAIKR
ncbi:arsenite methyltransferase [Methanocella conradii]|uniref:arsenite methyltransferase n=1 Tax=Methanocella conradii TaxID=1175444 RepID=UPI0024B33CC2|nr:arsenite methyltransferase [Methanocella conradii]MDI6897851.1 arsenite methyltransferase [Methanocella conradii]